MRTRAWGIVCLLALASQASAATLAEINYQIRGVEIQLLIIDVMQVGASARLSDQQFQLDRQIMLLDAKQIPLATKIQLLQVAVDILIKHQAIQAVRDEGGEYRANVSCYIQAATMLRDAQEYDQAALALGEASRNATLAEARYAEADRMLGETDVRISELKALIAAW